MKLPFSFGFRKKEEPTYFLALLLRDERIIAAIFEELFGKVRVVSQEEALFGDSLESASIEEFLDTLDAAVSKAEQALPKEVETHKTIFGIKGNWVEEGKIKKECLSKLKKACDALGLEPLGFLVIHEAIAHLLQKEEGAPVSAILVEVEKQHLGVTLLRAGRLVETKRTKREDPAPATTDRMLHHFTNYEVLPSRLIIFDGVSKDEHTESIIQEFIAHQWSKSLPFLHVPQITPLPKGFAAKAVLFGAATQMGFEVLQEGREESEPTRSLPQTSATAFGFEVNTDVAATREIKHEKEMQRQTLPLQPASPPLAHEGLRRGKRLGNHILEVTHTFLGNAVGRGKRFAPLLARFPEVRGKMLFLPPLIVAVILLIFVIYLFGIKATVTLIVSPRVVERNQDITFSIDGSSDLSKNTIAGKFVLVSQEGTVETTTTGKKELGDKAKGTIMIFSRLSDTRTFSQGTALTSSNDLLFVLDKDITIASSSADASSPPTTLKAAITAKNIGKEYNVPSGTKFTIGQISQVLLVAKNDAPFEGGTKREIPSVAKDDLEKLTDELPKKLAEKAKGALAKTATREEGVLPTIVGATLVEQNFSKKAGEEATKVSLAGTVSYQSIAYRKEELDAISKQLLKPEGSTKLSKDGIQYEVTNVTKKKEKEVQATLKLKASLLPEIDEETMRRTIAGKSFDEVQATLSQIPQVQSVDIILLPKLPFLPHLLPRLEGNVQIAVQTE